MTAPTTTEADTAALAMGGGRGASSTLKSALTNRIGSALAIVIAVLWTVPTFGLLLSSLRPEAQIKGSGWWTFFSDPAFTLQNYQQVLGGSSSTNLSQYFLNSIVIAVPSTLLPLSLAIMAAYAFTAVEWRGRGS